MGCGQSLPKEPRVVIVGAGYIGSYLGFKLQKETFCSVTVVDPKDAMLHNIGALRCIVEPEFMKNVFIPYSQFLTSFVQQSVTSIKKDKNHVILKNGKKLPYEYLVIATGSNNPFPGKFGDQYEISSEEGRNMYKNMNDAVKKAHRVLCVGGGAVGVELAGEIKTDYPDKQVIIVHPTKVLVSSRLPKELQESLQQKLDRKDIELVLDDRVNNLDALQLNKHVENQKVTTQNGKEIEVDLVLDCSGIKIASQFCKPALEGAMKESGAIKVGSDLLVEGCSNIFAIGDVNDTNVQKMMYTGTFQANTVAENLKALIQGAPTTSYQPGDFGMVVTIGRYDGVGFFGGKVLDEDECRAFKSENLLNEMVWTQRGLSVPE